MKNAHQFAKPIRVAIGEFEFQNDQFIEAVDGVGHLGLYTESEVWFGLDLPIEGDAHLVIVAHIGFTHVGDMDARFGMDLVHQVAEALDGNQLIGAFRDKMLRFGKVAAEEQADTVLAYAAALLEDAIIHPALDLKKDR